MITINRSHVAVSILVALLLGGCKSRKEDFLASCQSNHTAEQCVCLFDVTNDALNDEQFAMFSALVSRDVQTQSRIQSSLGFADAAIMATKLSWVAYNVETACGKW